MESTLTGKVKFYNAVKGYGFIIEDNGTKERFFHITNVTSKEALKENDLVIFTLLEDQRGIRAINVEKQ
jgi:CspA family cold shock protein